MMKLKDELTKCNEEGNLQQIFGGKEDRAWSAGLECPKCRTKLDYVDFCMDRVFFRCLSCGNEFTYLKASDLLVEGRVNGYK